ncbi:serine/threonine protein kinase, partial [Paenibacillus darwinianus]
MIGRELGGRYEIIERIGSGGMALVYKAHDVLLNRKVAVKILRQQFGHDEEFVRRFRREAQSAASLSHPNVVSIYDVGEEEDTHYIVMEYVEGSNLNDLIKERAPLQTEEAVRFAVQICDALDHAHQNQIIHRDIKPHNILIGKNGRVKVTDFGIARAVTSSTITQTGSVVGSVHYFSPEHAKGISTGEKSDLYSLGIVLYQMLTGRLPFLGESPISVALKHLQDDFEEPRQVNPHIPQSLENIILRSMRKNSSERYASAQEMLEDLETCLKPERLNEPKIAFTQDLDETRAMPAIRGAAAASAGVETKWVDEPETKRRWVKPLLTVLITLLVIFLVYMGVRTVIGIMDTNEVDVPYVVGQTEAAARQMLADAGLKVEEPVVYEERKDVTKDTVFEQSKTNMRVKEGSFIKLYVSKGPRMEAMPDFSGRKYADAVEELVNLGMVEEEQISREEVFDDAAPGSIIAQSIAAGASFDPGADKIAFTVSKGRETFEMPNLLGMKQQVALNELQKRGLKPGPDSGVVKEPSYSPEGTVIDQFPYKAGDAVAKGSEVTVTVSSGLPDDALKYTFNILISPAVIGQSSEIRIEYSDARGEKIDWGKKTIKDTQSFPVEVVLGPNTEAVVTVYRDGKFTDSFPITYDEAKNGGAGNSAAVPGMTQEQPVEPSA